MPIARPSQVIRLRCQACGWQTTRSHPSDAISMPGIRCPKCSTGTVTTTVEQNAVLALVSKLKKVL